MGGFKHILVPLDGSEASELGLNAAKKAVADGGHLSIVRIADLVSDHHLPTDTDKQAFWDKQLAPVNSYLENLAEELDGSSYTFSTETASGHPVEVILKWVSEGQIDAVAMCTHTESKLRQFLLGSVFQSVLEKCPVPVIVVHPPANT